MSMPHIAGVGMTPFGRHRSRTLSSLAVEAETHALDDAGLSTSDDTVIVGNAVQGAIDGQHGIRGQLVLAAMDLGNVCSTTLPPKAARYTTTRGKLTQDECNDAARALSPTYIAKRSRHPDDSWIKYNVGDPRADELYRATQANSKKLAGKGAGLRRADVEALSSGA